MRILWISDSPTSPSGFGSVTAAVCRRLAERGHRVEIVGWQTRDTSTRWEGIPVHPVRHDLFGADVLLGYLMRFNPEFVITLADVWWMAFMADPAVQRWLDMSGSRWVLYYPIDGADVDGRLPPGWIKMLETADVPVAMSRFGMEVSAACGVEARYLPHGCELEIFTPAADKAAAKARLGYKDAFVVLSDARNQPRKLLPRTLEIAAAFAADKEDVVVHLHTDPDDDAASSDLYSYRLSEDVDALGLADRVRLTQNFKMRAAHGLPLGELAALYQAADAHLLSSWGEGFGLPNLQAASAGVVPIAVAYAASRELVEGHGYAIPPESSVVDEFGLVRCLIGREGAVNALDELYRDRALLARRAEASRSFARDYGWDEVVDSWEEVLGATPPRRRPARSRTFEWVGGAQATGPAAEPDLAPASHVFSSLPEGTAVSVRMAERRHGEVSAEIRRDAFLAGDELSIPVRLRPAFEGCPRAKVGSVLCGPADVGVAASLQELFPCVAVSVPRPDGDPKSREYLPLAELVAALPHYSLAVDFSRESHPQLDVACAALGVPYAGPSALWPEIPSATPLLQLRHLVTDQGFSDWRREVAEARARDAAGDRAIQALRDACLAGQPEPVEPSAKPPVTPLSDIEMFLVKTTPGSGPGGAERIAEFATLHGGLVLMATANGSLIVAMPHGKKEPLEEHPLTAFVGGIGLEEDGKGAKALKRLFATNAAKQLIARTPAGAVGGGRSRSA
jgi:glycosyltransferase involved in cell wall biosynthesis